jgi:protein TonB
MPIGGEGGWRGPVVSILLHALLVLALLAPAIAAERTLFDAPEGGGGPGPAGGGGGGSGGSGGQPVEERLQYIDIAPNAIPALIPEVPTPLPEPVIVPPPEPVVPPPPPPVTPVPEAPKVEVPPATIAAPTPSVIAGVGGGSGNDGTAGMGPGSGGGVGSGIGTGRGSDVGPGTGGGNGNIFPPRATTLLLPPSNAPDRIKPYTITAFFDVDEKGRVIKFEFNESKDRDYNRKVKEMLAQVRFRPATTLDGVAIRATARIDFTVF